VRHPTYPDEILEVPGDELRAVVRDDAGRSPGNISRARWMIVSTSGSCMFGRISQWTMNRLYPSKMQQGKKQFPQMLI